MSEALTHHEQTIELPTDWEFFAGHFPNHPIAPGAAQLTALVQPSIREVWPKLGAPRGLKRVKFLQEIHPGDRLSLSLSRRDEARVRFRLSRGAELCSTGELHYTPSLED